MCICEYEYACMHVCMYVCMYAYIICRIIHKHVCICIHMSISIPLNEGRDGGGSIAKSEIRHIASATANAMFGD